MVKKKKQGRGRPPKAEKDKKKTVTVSLRMDRELRDGLEHDAVLQEKTLNKEIVDRLKWTLPQGGYIDNWVFGVAQNHNLMRLIGMMTRNIQASEGDEIWNNPAAHQELKDAVVTILDAFGPDGKIPKPIMKETPGQRRGRSWLNQFYNARALPERTADERKTADGEFIDYTVDEYAWPKIWEGLGSLGKKLENDNE